MKITTGTLIVLIILTILPYGRSIAQSNMYDQQKEDLQRAKDSIILLERERLKKKVEKINELLRKQGLSQKLADSLKTAAAEEHANNIKLQTAILEQKNEVLDEFIADLSKRSKASIQKTAIQKNTSENEQQKYHTKGVYSDLVIGIGINNTLSEQHPIDDSEYKYLGSRFFELGWAWTADIFKHSDFFRLKSGFSLHFNGLKPEGNRYFVKEGTEVKLVEFEYPLKKSKLLNTNLVLPLHLEFGNKSIRVFKNNNSTTYYRNNSSLILGIGGYVGFNIDSFQKLKYRVDGKREKEKRNNDLNVTKLVYGISGYLAFSDFAVYAKYDITPVFKDQIIPQNNISLGVRFDIR